MLKVNYFSHHLEESGYGRYCRSFLNALKTTDFEIASYAVKLGKVGNYKDETEKNSLYNPDIIIQNILPHLMSKCQQKCIGGAILETKDVRNNVWGQHLDMMDAIFYPHYPLGIFEKEFEIPCPVNIDKYIKEYPKINIEEADGKYKFLWIGELSKRKNLSGLIKAYFNTFSANDPVSLIIKCHKPNFDTSDCQREIQELIHTIMHGCKLYDSIEYYPQIIPICDYWPKEKIYSLHKYANCYVSTSHGEAINLPMLDALFFNKKVISTCTFATETYIKYGRIELVPSDYQEPCFGQVETFNFYQSFRESWNSFDINAFGNKMLKVYGDTSRENNDATQLSYKNVGKKIKQAIELII